jgi:hypothetical protein
MVGVWYVPLLNWTAPPTRPHADAELALVGAGPQREPFVLVLEVQIAQHVDLRYPHGQRWLLALDVREGVVRDSPRLDPYNRRPVQADLTVVRVGEVDPRGRLVGVGVERKARVHISHEARERAHAASSAELITITGVPEL